MPWPFLYFAGDRLSSAELTSARLDGDVVEVGDAFMPADAIETRELRAGSLRERVPETLALVRESAAWVHGAVMDAPVRHTVQRRSPLRVSHVIDARLAYSDQPLSGDDAMTVSGVWITTPARTLADLVRALCAGDRVSNEVEAMIAWRPGLIDDAIAVLERGTTLHFKRPALAYLRARGGEVDACADRQEEITR